MCKTRADQVGRTVILFLILGLAHLSICDGVLNSLKSSDLGGMLGRVCGGNCVGLVEEEEEDVEMESESNRRILMIQRKRSGGVANPYTRGCEVIAGCARNIRDINT
uniref:Uncharacterized protein n=1 Tax=Kalanchoe fedtschenkoi TaxID=63787 RepID=A0A7N0TSU8_KALFE